MEFGQQKNHGFEFGKGTGATHCPRCMRSKDDAIFEQTYLGECCDDEECFFKNEILLSIQEKKYSRFCINCGTQFEKGDLYCIHCGTKRITL